MCKQITFTFFLSVESSGGGLTCLSPKDITQLKHKLSARVFPEAVHDKVYCTELSRSHARKSTTPMLSKEKKLKHRDNLVTFEQTLKGEG